MHNPSVCRAIMPRPAGTAKHIIPHAQISPSSRRSFSISPALHTRKGLTRQRKSMWQWLKGPGSVFREPPSAGTNYLSDYDRDGRPRENSDNDKGPQPFPLNPYFHSPRVLSVPFRDEIHRRVTSLGQTVREVSQELGVSMERVGAVVRLREMEAQSEKEVRLVLTLVLSARRRRFKR